MHPPPPPPNPLDGGSTRTPQGRASGHQRAAADSPTDDVREAEPAATAGRSAKGQSQGDSRIETTRSGKLQLLWIHLHTQVESRAFKDYHRGKRKAESIRLSYFVEKKLVSKRNVEPIAVILV